MVVEMMRSTTMTITFDFNNNNRQMMMMMVTTKTTTIVTQTTFMITRLIKLK